MEKDAKIFVAGHRGLVGSALLRFLNHLGHTSVITRSRSELDLSDSAAVASFFATHRPQYVFLAAAKVGGIVANSRFPADFIEQNLSIELNVIHQAWKCGVRRLVFLGSSCIYPRDCQQPIREEYLLTGPLEVTNQAYAIAKIAGVEMCAAYNLQHGTQFVCIMPTNLYGIADNYNLQSSHVLPALIRKAHEAKVSSAPSFVAWGSGKPRRELMYADDLASACWLLATRDWVEITAKLDGDRMPLFNAGTGTDLSIAELAAEVSAAIGFNGAITWDSEKPDGTPQKLLDSSRMNALGWRPSTSLRKGIEEAYRDFLTRATL